MPIYFLNYNYIKVTFFVYQVPKLNTLFAPHAKSLKV